MMVKIMAEGKSYLKKLSELKKKLLAI